MKRLFVGILALAALAGLLAGCTRLPGVDKLPGSGALAPEAAPFEFVDGKAKVLIGFRALPGPAEEALVRAHGGEVRFTYRIVPAIAATLPEPAIEALRRNPHVTVVEPDVTVYAHDLTSELNNTWGVKRIGAGTVHTWGNLGAGVKVAVIDTGIDYTHPELAAVYAGGYDFVNKDSDPWDDNGHGTHVAGTVAAVRNGTGVVGAAPAVQLYALKVLGANGSGSFSAIVAALEWCMSHGIQVTNLSLGSSKDPGETVRQAFDNAYAAGILHVASAGNSGEGTDTVGWPAKYESVIAVAASTSSDTRASFSSTGPAVELAAPGVAINSTIPGGGYASWSGTSMAAPHVTGTAALVWAANPTWTNVQVRQRLTETADDLGAAGRDPWYGYGLVDADEAAASPPPPPATGAIRVVKTVSGPAPATAWAFSGTGAIGSFTLPAGGGERTFSGLPVGTYTITETPKDGYTVAYRVNGGALQDGNVATVALSENATVTVEFVNTYVPPTPMWVSGIEMRLVVVNKNFTAAQATVTVVDASGKPVSGATVTGVWSGVVSGTASGTTDVNGRVAFQCAQVRKPASGARFTFCVTGISKAGWSYEPSRNVETCDSVTAP